jgi:8-demethyl-8-alpha-L-rhamnosyltetracenomycin-C 2'-O-methyltransferase
MHETQRQVSELIMAADLHGDALIGAIERVKPARVVEILMDELVYRSGVGPVQREYVVQFVLEHGGVAYDYVVTFSRRGVRGQHGAAEQRHVLVRQELPELLRSVFGAQHAISSATRVVSWLEQDDPAALGRLAQLTPLVEALLSGSEAGGTTSLSRLAARFGSDKWGSHSYTQHYQRHFEPYRDRPLALLELGIGGYADPAQGGASLRMWKSFFRRAMVYGVDIVDKSGLEQQRIVPFQGDQSSPESLLGIVAQTGPLDIVIDDGSHRSEHVLTSFRTLFPHVRPGGLYVIEDLLTSYWPGWGGSAEQFDNPATSVGFLKTLIDGLNHEEIPESAPRKPEWTDTRIRGLHFYHNLAIIERGSNAEGGGPAWIPR